MEKVGFLCVLLYLVVLSHARISDDENLRRAGRLNFPSVQAGKLIRELNLFPKSEVNVIDGIDGVDEPKTKRVVEKRFRFPNVVGFTEEDLGHHAGYYDIQHSYAAR